MFLTLAEAKAVYELIDQLSGGNPENVFAWDGSDDWESPLTRAMVKLFRECKRKVPANLEDET